jgi:NADPH:quinone reductase-like Zn-dependent oxidoreductase
MLARSLHLPHKIILPPKTSRTISTMKAAVIYEPGPPSVLKIERRPIPTPKEDETLIKVKAFGINRSEMFTRQGASPNVLFPRILGIEAVGLVEECPNGKFIKGQQVATVMGGMGRDFDGGYAEFTAPKTRNVRAFESQLSWDVTGAVPEMLQTAYGSLFKSLRLQKDDRVLIRGGTTSIGLAAAAIASGNGNYVAATTRDKSKATAEVLEKHGVKRVLIDDGNVHEQVKDEKFDKVLELVGTTTLRDSLKCMAPFGITCMTGIVVSPY